MSMNFPTTSNASKYFLVTGKIGHPYVGDTVEYVYKQVHAAKQVKHRKTGVQDAIALLHRKLQPVEEFITDYCEDAQVVATTLGDEVLCGRFLNVRHLRHGDHVSAVVTRVGGLLRARAILRTSDHLMLFWGYSAGPGIAFRKSMKPAIFFTAFFWSIMVPVWFYLGQEGETGPVYYVMLVIMMLFIALLAAHSHWEMYEGRQDQSADAADVYATFGFPHPEYFDANDGLTHMAEGSTGYFAINIELALARQKTKYRIPV